MLTSTLIVKGTSVKNLELQIVHAASVLIPRLIYDSHRIEAHDDLLLPLDQVLLIPIFSTVRLTVVRFLQSMHMWACIV